MSRRPGDADKQPRRHRTDWQPFPPLAKDDGRTVKLSGLGLLSPAVYNRIAHEAGSWPQKVERCVQKLMEIEAEQ